MWNHWVVRASSPEEPFQNFESGRLAWFALSRLFPEKLAAVLMPNHFHLILPRKTKDFRQRVSGLLSTISRRSRTRRLWQPIPAPSAIPDVFHLRRQLRYLALNPCRRGLCADPLEWYWSSYREIIGATPLACVQLARALEMPERDFRVRFHAYVSGDPSVAVSGTPLPLPAQPQARAFYSIGQILDASAATLRMHPVEVESRTALRRFFIHFAWRHGWQQPSVLAEICKMSRQGIHRALQSAPPAGLSAGDLCLGDARLRRAKWWVGEVDKTSTSSR